jgi:hypothetical protein
VKGYTFVGLWDGYQAGHVAALMAVGVLLARYPNPDGPTIRGVGRYLPRALDLLWRRPLAFYLAHIAVLVVAEASIASTAPSL